MPDVLTADDARRWALVTRAALAARRAEIDALNVFPVPDGDTGTNLYLTLDGAIEDATATLAADGVVGPADLVRECETLRRSILMSARGNSGVILSQVVGGLCEVVVDRAATEVDAAMLAECLERGAQAARRSVARPQEGTILTVADAAAAAARRAAEEALARTPEQLPALARAGVVDAGGAGCVLLLEALHRVVTGAWTADDAGLHHSAQPSRSVTAGTAPDPGHDPVPEDYAGPAYEVMYLLSASSEEAVAQLRSTLDGLGDSLLVVGGPDLWNVHVHVDDPGAAVEAGIAAGHPERVRITRLVEPRPDRPAAVGVVAGAAGPGIAALMAAAGAVPVDTGPGRRPSATQVLDAVRRAGTPAVVVLPADPDVVLAAEVAATAAAGEGLEVHVVPARTTVQALAALAVLDPARGAHPNVVAMTGAALSTRHGAVTVASTEALTSAGVCRPGDVLGVVDGDVVLLGDDASRVAHDVLARLLAPGGELVTLVVGSDVDPGLGDAVAADLRRERPDLEVQVLGGGQPVYSLLVGVE